MVSEDPLAAAKSAALQDLISLNVTENQLPSQPPKTSKEAPSSKTRRRRRRPQPQRGHHHPSLASPSSQPNANVEANVEYVPEAVDETDLHAIADEHNASAVGLIMSAINRFAEMGPDAVQTRPSADAQNSISGAANGQLNVPSESDQTRHAAETNGASEQPKTTQPLSRKKQKEHRRTLIARLKEIADVPEVVESWDINSPDPILLVHLKALPNSVPVPVNWSQKRKYLQNKRGMEKRPFQLPAYIMDTGVGSLRDAQIEADEKKTLKQKQREKMRAKTGKGIDIDTQRLHDAFFKFQTKPRLTKHGEVYYELKELETDPSQFAPGYLSEELRAALGVAENDPPPWLINMQRYGPPPGYPDLVVPGVNAPIPPGARFGYQVGGWGKPPVDPSGRPLYGDVFGEGLSYSGEDAVLETTQAEKEFLWGEIRPADAGVTVRAEDIKSDGEDENEPDGKDGKVRTGWTPTQLPTTTETGKRRDDIADGKEGKRNEQDVNTNVRKGIADGKLFTVLEQRKVAVSNKEMMGSSHVYDVERGSASDMRGRNVAHIETGPDKIAGQCAEDGDGLDKRKRDVSEDHGKSTRPKKKQKEFKF